MANRLGAFASIAILSLFVFWHGTAAANGMAEIGPVNAAAIDRYVEREMRTARIPGMAIGIVRGDQIVYVKGYGVADPIGRPVTPQTPFSLGSVSKSFTALAVMQLAEAGKLDLDAPVRRYLPWFTLVDPAAAQQITVRHLLNHTSGISTSAGEIAFVGEPGVSIEALIRKQAILKLASRPGGKFQYSNLNYVILGGIVEAVSGESYAEYIARHIFGPLGMAHSAASPEQAGAKGLATGYQYFFGLPRPVVSVESPATMPAGRLISSAEDMSRYLAMWLNEGQYGGSTVVSSVGCRELQRPATPVTSYIRYGMGWYANPDASVVWHGGSTENFRASMKILYRDRLAVVALYNITDDTLQAVFGGGYLIQDGIISILYGTEPPVSGIINTGQVYFLLDAAGLLAMVAVVVHVLRVRQWRAALGSGGRKRMALIATMAVINYFLPILVLLAIPRIVAWPVVLANVPDYGYLVIGIALVLLGTGLAKAGLLIADLLGR